MSETKDPQETLQGIGPSSPSLFCVYCGKQHPDDATFCPLTGKPIDRATWVRDAAGDDRAASDGGERASALASPEPATRTRGPVPQLPELPKRVDDMPRATYVDSARFLIRGMGNRADEIAARFFNRLTDRGIDGLKLSVGQLVAKLEGERLDSRAYYFVERNLADAVQAGVAVRIAPVGTDLFVEWRHYVILRVNQSFNFEAGWAVGATVFLGFGMVLLVSLKDFGAAFWIDLLVAVVLAMLSGGMWFPIRTERPLEGFQAQDSTALQLSVRAALEEAIDLAGISKELFQELREDDDKNRRVI